MRPVRKMNEVRHLGDWHPGNLLVVQHIILQDRQPGAGIRFGDLLVAAPALGQRWQPGRRSTQCTRVAVQALHTEIYMNVMSKLNRLFGGLLGCIDPIGRNTEQCQAPDQHCDQSCWLKEPSRKFSNHAYSCGKISSFRTFMTHKVSADNLFYFAAQQDMDLTVKTKNIYKRRLVPVTLQ
jgi:hypothetical protein